MLRSLAIASIFTLGALTLGASTADAQRFGNPGFDPGFNPGGRGGQCLPPVNRYRPWRCRTFHCYEEACRFRTRLRRLGYETRLYRTGRCWHVKYRRCFGGVRPLPGPGPIFNPGNEFPRGRGQVIIRGGVNRGGVNRGGFPRR